MKLVVILVIFSLISGIFATECAPGHEVTLPLMRIGEKFYYIPPNTQANWFGALHFCTYHNLRLAKIQNAQENIDLGQHLPKLGLEHVYFWLSGNDLAESGSWFWSSSGEKVTFFNWGPGEPNKDHGDQEHCLDAYALNGTLNWNDDVCTYNDRSFVCELV